MDENIDLKKLKLAPAIRKFLRQNFIHFFIDGFIILNNAITLGIIYKNESLNEYWFLWILTPLLCMGISYMEAYNLFKGSYNLYLKDLLHYMYITFFIIGFNAGILFCINPINLILFISILYLIVGVMELAYYKKYCKVFSLYTLKLTKKFINIKIATDAINFK